MKALRFLRLYPAVTDYPSIHLIVLIHIHLILPLYIVRLYLLTYLGLSHGLSCHTLLVSFQDRFYNQTSFEQEHSYADHVSQVSSHNGHRADE